MTRSGITVVLGFETSWRRVCKKIGIKYRPGEFDKLPDADAVARDPDAGFDMCVHCELRHRGCESLRVFVQPCGEKEENIVFVGVILGDMYFADDTEEFDSMQEFVDAMASSVKAQYALVNQQVTQELQSVFPGKKPRIITFPSNCCE